MHTLRIGIYLDHSYQPNSGGAWSYVELLIEKINFFEFDPRIEIVFLTEKPLQQSQFKKRVIVIPKEKFTQKQWNIAIKMMDFIFSLRFIEHFIIHEKIRNRIKAKVNSLISLFLAEHEIDLIYYPAPNLQPLNYPFIATNWDLGHKTMIICHDVYSNTRFEKVEYYYRVTLQKAFAIFVESELSKRELMDFEGIHEQRIFILPLFAGKVVDMNVTDEDQVQILNNWGLNANQFYFYPAQFWPHKNHYGLIKAFKAVASKYPQLKLVLSGSQKGNLDYIKAVVKSEGLESKIIFTGFASNKEVYTFYKNAIALVMPTLLGPTNMPLLEAYHLGCHVLCSNLPGHIQQMGDKANYFDPLNTEDMMQKMLAVINKPKSSGVKQTENTIVLLNQHFLSLLNARKTFGYETLNLKRYN